MAKPTPLPSLAALQRRYVLVGDDLRLRSTGRVLKSSQLKIGDKYFRRSRVVIKLATGKDPTIRQPAKAPIRTAIRVLRELIEIADKRMDLTDHNIEEAAGVYNNFFMLSRRGKINPGIDKVEAVGQVLGFRLAWVSISSNLSHDNSRQE